MEVLWNIPSRNQKGLFIDCSAQGVTRLQDSKGNLSQGCLLRVMQAIRISAPNVITNYKLPPLFILGRAADCCAMLWMVLKSVKTYTANKGGSGQTEAVNFNEI